MKIKYVLPVVQMALAGALLWLDQVWFLAAVRKCDVPGPSSPAFGFLMSINAPLVLPRTVWDRYLPFYWSQAALIVSVGLLWYWLAGNVPTWWRRRFVFNSLWRPARFTVDVVLIVLGLLCGLAALSFALDVVHYPHSYTHAVGCFGPNLWSHLLPGILIACLYLVWSLAAVLLFGNDFMRCIRGNNRLSPKTS